MIEYHCGSNIILQATFATRADKHRIPAYNLIMKRLADRGHKVDHQVLDNKDSAEYTGPAGSNHGNLGPVPAPVAQGCRGPHNTLLLAL